MSDHFDQIVQRAHLLLCSRFEISTLDGQRLVEALNQVTREQILRGEILDATVVDHYAQMASLSIDKARTIYAEIWRTREQLVNPTAAGSSHVPDSHIVTR